MRPYPALRRLLRETAGYPRWMILAGFLSFLTIGSSVGLLMSSAYIIARAALHPSIAAVQVAVVGVRFFGIARGGFRYLERLVSHDLTFRLLARLRGWFYRHLEPLAPAGLHRRHSGDLLSRVMADIETLQHVFIRLLAPPAVALAVLLLLFGILAPIDLGAALLFAGCYLFAAVPLPLLTRSMSRSVGQRLAHRRAALRITSLDWVAGAAELQVLGRDRDALAAADQENRALTRDQRHLARITGLHEGAVGFLMNAAVLGLLIRLIPQVHTGDMSGITLTVCILGVMASFEAVQPLPDAVQVADECESAARRLLEIADTPAPSPNHPHPPDSVLQTPSPFPFLRVQRLTFSYPDSPSPVLQDVNFDLSAGRRVALIGPSGAGKSTLAQLLLQFQRVPPGSLFFQGRDLCSLPPEQIRGQIGFVGQDTHLFTGTLRENLLLADPKASVKEQEAAVDMAGLRDRWEATPEGPDTQIGEYGLQLSGGERQRLALARALLSKPTLLLLDEPTAHLDAHLEIALLQTLFTLPTQPTLLLITHRLTQLEAMDEIIVLDQGRIREKGTHAELIAAQGHYARLHKLHLETSIIETGA